MMNSWMGRTCIAVLVAAVISGCGGAEQTPNDRQTPPIRPSAESPSLTPTPTADEILTEPEREYPEPPVRPAEMARDDVDGAVAAAEYFLMLYPYVYATGELGEWEAMSHPDCNFCASVIGNVIQKSELEFRGGEIEVLESFGETHPGSRYYFAELIIEVSEGEVLRGGRVLEETMSEQVDVVIALVRQNDDWLIYGVETYAEDI